MPDEPTATAPETPPAAPAAPAEPTKSEPDWKAEARKWEQRSKENAKAQEELDKLKQAQMTEQQKLEERAARAEGRLPALELENARLKVALAKGLPSNLAARLQGATVEELEADADELVKLLPAPGASPGRPTGPDLRQGQHGNQAPPTGDAWLRGMAKPRNR